MRKSSLEPNGKLANVNAVTRKATEMPTEENQNLTRIFTESYGNLRIRKKIEALQIFTSIFMEPNTKLRKSTKTHTKKNRKAYRVSHTEICVNFHEVTWRLLHGELRIVIICVSVYISACTKAHKNRSSGPRLNLFTHRIHGNTGISTAILLNSTVTISFF